MTVSKDKRTIIFSFVGLVLIVTMGLYYNPPDAWRSVTTEPTGVLVSSPRLEIGSQNRDNFFIVAEADLPWSGFIIARRPAAAGSVVLGVSDYLSAGSHTNIIIVNWTPAITGETLQAQLVRDDGDGLYEESDQTMPVSQDFIVTVGGLEFDSLSTSTRLQQ